MNIIKVMDPSNFRDSLSELFERKIEIEGNFISLDRQSQSPNQMEHRNCTPLNLCRPPDLQ